MFPKKKNEPDSLDFALSQVCRLHYLRVHELLESIGLYRGQPPVLMALWEKDGLTHSDLARRLDITRATMTKMVQRMERTGFLTRQPDALDQRISRVYLTEQGRLVRERLQELFQTIEAETFAGLSESECSSLKSCFTKIRANLQSALSQPSNG